MFNRIKQTKDFCIPSDWTSIKTIDLHTGGEPLRIILNGLPEIKGNNVLEARRYFKENLDNYRKLLMFEPRGHVDMYGCVILPPNDSEGDFGVLFLHNEGYSTMCGHAIIAISTLAGKMGWIKELREGENVLKIDAPCGRITAIIKTKNKKVQGVQFQNVPSFVVGLDRVINIPGLGEITYDLAYGGAFYAYVDLNKNNLDINLEAKSYRKLISYGMQIKKAVIQNDHQIFHPFEEDLSFLYGTIFTGDAKRQENESRNVCIFAEGEVDRCPTGSGAAGRMAIHYARKELSIGQKMKIESITDSVFEACVKEELDYGPFKAVIPEISGTAHITGMHQFIFDPKDPIKSGFILR